MTILLTLLHVLVAVFLIAVVLLQTGKRADLAGAFGGGGSQTAFGTRGAATVLSKMTTAAAVLFMLTSITLSLVSSRSAKRETGSVLDEVPAQSQTAPTGSDDTGLPTLPPVDADATGGATTEQPAEDTTTDESTDGGS